MRLVAARDSRFTPSALSSNSRTSSAPTGAAHDLTVEEDFITSNAAGWHDRQNFGAVLVATKGTGVYGVTASYEGSYNDGYGGTVPISGSCSGTLIILNCAAGEPILLTCVAFPYATVHERGEHTGRGYSNRAFSESETRDDACSRFGTGDDCGTIGFHDPNDPGTGETPPSCGGNSDGDGGVNDPFGTGDTPGDPSGGSGTSCTQYVMEVSYDGGASWEAVLDFEHCE